MTIPPDRKPQDQTPQDQTPQRPAPLGRVGGRYDVEREIGHGGTAIVFRALDARTGRHVAVKVLKPEFAGSVATQRFLNEIALTTELQHPHILALQDSGTIDGLPGLDGLPYHVSPFLEGESLRARLDRERQLPVDDAVRIALEVADALEYAHGRGVVHRDVKPENILFSGRHACVADFGIARAFASAAGERLTATGVTVGTPAYMSPEQASGERDLDARSDVYSLACVTYEMLAGVQPFIGGSAESVIAQRFAHPPRPLHVYRPNVPPHVEEAIARAMAVAPADRVQTAAAFAAMLAGGGPAAVLPGAHPAARTADVVPDAPSARPWRRRGPLALVAGAFALLSVVAAAAFLGDGGRSADGAVAVDAADARWAVLPVGGSGGRAVTAAEARDRLHAALGRWRGLDLAALDVTDRADGDGDGAGAGDVAAWARRLDAGRVVRVQLTPQGDSVQLRAAVYDAAGAVVREHVVRVPDRPGAHDGYRRLATALLRAAPPPDDADEGDLGTDVLAAWHAYARGHERRAGWDLRGAEQAFRQALDADPGYAHAQLWAAQVTAWQRPLDRDAWRDAASRAVAQAGRLATADSLLAHGVHALAQERYPEACDAYERLRALDPGRDLPWYGIGQCLAMDPAVVRDPGSPSGWRFRSSWHAAVAAYDSAIARAEGAPAFAFGQLARMLHADAARARAGRALPPDSLDFGAYATLDADTLAFVPYPSAEFAAGAPRAGGDRSASALRRNAALLAAYLATWVQRAPGDADALEALATVQEQRGERAADDAGGPRALGTVREARRLSGEAHRQVRLAASEIRLLVKEGQLDEARRLADSLLAANPRPDAAQAVHLAGTAALVGRAELAARLLGVPLAAGDAQPRPAAAPLPPAVAQGAARLTAYAALGVCADTIRALERAVEELLVRHVEPGLRERARTAAMARPLALAVPCLGRDAVARVPPSDSPLARMQAAWAAGRPDLVRAHFESLERMRSVDRPGDVTLDNVFQESWLLLAIGDTAAASRHLELPLTATTTLGTGMLRDVPQAAAFGRAMALRAELAAAAGDRDGARRWARAVTTLWSGADAGLQPIVARMQALDRQPQEAARR